MAVITIREQSRIDTGSFNATLVIDHKNYQTTVSDPFAPKQEQELEWYFEDWLSYPMLDNVKADRAKASVREYGENLFKQVFQADTRVYNKYSQLLNESDIQLQIEIESITPEFQAIHWEALQDPDLPRPLAIDSVLIRKSIQPINIEAKVKESPTINLLVVVARPKVDRDVPHRTISRPLVEAIRNAKLRVNIEILRPGTYEALAKHLDTKENGYYHIVHFDVHGSLQTYQTYQDRLEIGIYPEFRYGREEIEEYDGFKAFLALEGEEIGEYDPVEASEIADLLTGKNIPVCILNACQSGKQLNQQEAEDNRETSLGSRLMNAGMQMVVAMSYSVTVTAAEIIMQQIYQHLFDNQDINQAIRLGRKELYNRKARKAYYNTEIDLEDWLLPVVYCNGEVNFNLREFTPEEETQYYSNLASKYEFTQPTDGFVGRDIDILLIEKALLQHNILLLQGMGGTGKSTLLNHLREWWQVTNFAQAQDVVYIGDNKRAYTLQQIFFEISKQLYNQFDFERFQAKNINEQWQELSNKFHSESYILILDNLESITGKALAIQNTLEESDREEIRNFLASLVGGKTKVILGSRIAEEWLQESTFQDNHYQLQGLDTQARTNLAENILRRVNSSKSIDEIKTDEHFQRLMRLLAGHPLAMKVVISSINNKLPEEILEQFNEGELSLEDNNQFKNAIKSIEYSYNELSKSAQIILLCLAPYRDFINIASLKNYIKELSYLEFFKNYSLESLKSAIKEAVDWGLISPIIKNNLNFLIVQPLLPYFLTIRLKDYNNQIYEILKQGYRNHYQQLSLYNSKLMQSNGEHPILEEKQKK
ncbi:MAG: CHAT domain-containing protein [Cyanobacteria bacterium P01_G01_bin.39]